MKRQNKAEKIKSKPVRMTRAERKRLKLAERAREKLSLCIQIIEFHKAYLSIEFEYEEAQLAYLRERLEILQRQAEAELEAIRSGEAIIDEEPFEEMNETTKDVIEF